MFLQSSRELNTKFCSVSSLDRQWIGVQEVLVFREMKNSHDELMVIHQP